MAPIDFVLCVSALIVGLVAQKIILAIESNERWRRRRIARQPLEPIAGVVPGTRVKLSGHARPIAPLTSPRDGHEAIAWVLAVQHVAGGRERSARLDQACDFILRDASGELLVRGARAAVVCPTGAAVAISAPSPSLARCFAELGVDPRWLGSRWTPRAAEGVIAPDAPVVVFGVARRDGATLVVSADEQSPLYLSPAPELTGPPARS